MQIKLQPEKAKREHHLGDFDQIKLTNTKAVHSGASPVEVGLAPARKAARRVPCFSACASARSAANNRHTQT